MLLVGACARLWWQGTPNLSASKRYFFSVYYNISWLKHTDTCESTSGLFGSAGAVVS